MKLYYMPNACSLAPQCYVTEKAVEEQVKQAAYGRIDQHTETVDTMLHCGVDKIAALGSMHVRHV